MKKHALSGLLKLDGPLLSILSLLIAIVISGVIMAVCGYNPIEAFGAILAGSFGSQRAIVQTLTQATPLIFTGLAFAFAKKASLINLGAEGQLYMGALASAAVGMLDLGLPMALHLPLAVAAGMAAGGLYAGLVGVLKVKFGSNEVIATVMLNSIATYLVDYLLNGPMLAENSSVAQTERVLETAQLPRIFQQYQLFWQWRPVSWSSCSWTAPPWAMRSARWASTRTRRRPPASARPRSPSWPCASAAASRAWPAPAMCWAWTAA